MRVRVGCMAAVTVAMGMFSGAALAQAAAPAAGAPAFPVGQAGEVQRNYNGLKGNILKAADKMPADGYGTKPMADVRTYARIVNHVIEAQYRTCGAVNGVKDATKPPSDTADKATIVAALKASFDECDKAYASVTDTNGADMFAVGPVGKRSRLGMLWANVSHDNEQYAQLALYLRFKGLTPPSAEK